MPVHVVVAVPAASTVRDGVEVIRETLDQNIPDDFKPVTVMSMPKWNHEKTKLQDTYRGQERILARYRKSDKRCFTRDEIYAAFETWLKVQEERWPDVGHPEPMTDYLIELIEDARDAGSLTAEEISSNA